jgi:hypothetical protein
MSPFPAAAEENLGFTVAIFHFLTEKFDFVLILPSGLEAKFQVNSTTPECFASGESRVICAPP